MILWQPNPSSSNGQRGFQNTTGTSTAQMDGDTVGAYINSADLPGSPVGRKMMITPQFNFTAGNEPVPFAASGSSLGAEMDLQIPVALGPSTYVLADFLFVGSNGVRISYGIKIFMYNNAPSVVGGDYVADANVYQINSPLLANQLFVTPTSDSATATGTPRTGWQHFAWTISEAQFVAALNYLAAEYPGVLLSTDPTQYVLSQLHLNAEFHFQPGPAVLGWSMRGWQVWTTASGG